MNNKKDVHFEVLREESLRFRFKAVLEGRFPSREHAWPRTQEQEKILRDSLLRHVRKKGICKLKTGEYVLLGTYPENVAEYVREHGEFPH